MCFDLERVAKTASASTSYNLLFGRFHPSRGNLCGSPECAPCGRGEGGGAGAAGAAAVNDMLAAGLGNVEDMLASLLGGSAAAAERVGNRSRAGTGSSAAGGDVGDGSSATPPQGPGIKLASESDVGHDSRCEFCGEIIPVEVERTVIESDGPPWRWCGGDFLGGGVHRR